MTDQLRQRPGDQPLPTPNDRPHIHDLRRAVGRLAQTSHEARLIAEQFGIEVPPTTWQIRAKATKGGPCESCGRPRFVHVCLSCSMIYAPDDITPGPGCVNCRQTGWDQTPCRPPRTKP